jgi:hypothetical protein
LSITNKTCKSKSRIIMIYLIILNLDIGFIDDIYLYNYLEKDMLQFTY